jgi:hypothetical protein
VSRLADGLVAGGVAAVLSGIPSTVHALATGGDPLEATRAAGSIVLGEDATDDELLVAAVPVHLAISLGWGVVLAYALPRRPSVVRGVLAGFGIAALDLGVIGRRFPRLRRLSSGAQIADHVAYGVVVAAVLRRRGSA